jgi:SAM-dependent methyltransferase
MIEIDACHRQLIGAMVAAAKPERVLELGFGTGATTNAILESAVFGPIREFAYALVGKQDIPLPSVTVVDNWLDNHGCEPMISQKFRNRGVVVITADERDFLAATPDDTYDFLVSDADHHGDWCEEHFRVTRPGAICFFHDTNTPHIYPGLARTVAYVRERGWSHYHFTKSTLPGEECCRGLLFVVNGKAE